MTTPSLVGICQGCDRHRWLRRVLGRDREGKPFGICRSCDRDAPLGEQSRAGIAHNRVAQCTGKLKHNSKAEAKRHLKRARALQGRGYLAAYRCPWCGYWHLGSKASRYKEAPEEA